MNIVIKNVFDEMINSFEREKVLIVDEYVFKIIKRIYTKQDFIDRMIIDVISTDSDFKTNPSDYLLNYLVNYLFIFN
jgi:hypothetical protein